MSTNTQGKNENWDFRIEPVSAWYKIDFNELWRYRFLIWLFVRRDFVAFYKQTILGPIWYVLQPLFTTVVFTIIFGRVAKISTDDLPPFLFYMAGNVMWGYFSSCLVATSNTFINNTNLFGKVYFPRLSVPIANVIINILQFVIQFSLFMLFYIYFYRRGAPIFPRIWILALPILLCQMAILSLGLGILISSFTTKYKDLRFAMGFFVQLWMYGTPIVYPLSQIPDWLLGFYILNPMVAVVESFRYAFLGSSSIQWYQIGISWTISIIILFIGLVLFNKIEKTFMDTI